MRQLEASECSLRRLAAGIGGIRPLPLFTGKINAPTFSHAPDVEGSGQSDIAWHQQDSSQTAVLMRLREYYA